MAGELNNKQIINGKNSMQTETSHHLKISHNLKLNNSTVRPPPRLYAMKHSPKLLNIKQINLNVSIQVSAVA